MIVRLISTIDRFFIKKKNIMPVLAFLLLFVLPAKVTAQIEVLPDSLQSIYQNASDVEKYRILKKISWEQRDSTPSKSYYLAEYALIIAKKQKDYNEIASINNYMGIFLRNVNNYSLALEYFIGALNISDSIDNDIQKAYAYNNIGDIQRRINNDSIAELNHRKALEIFKKNNDQEGIGYCYNQLCMLYIHMEKYSEAIDCNNKSFFIREQSGNEKGINANYFNFGDIYFAQGNFDKAEEYYLLVLERTEELGQTSVKGLILHKLGKLYYTQKKYEKAIELLEWAIEIGERYHSFEIIKRAALQLSLVYEKLTDFENSYKYHKIFTSASDSIYNQEQTKKITVLAYKNKFEEEIKILNEKNQLTLLQLEHEQRLRYLFAIILILMTGFIIFIIISRLKLKRYFKNELRLLKQLKDLDDDHKKILDANTDIVFMLDSEGKQMYINTQVENLLGYKREDLIGKAAADFMPKGEIELHFSKFEERFINRSTNQSETFLFHSNGGYIPVEIVTKVIRFNGENVVVGTIRDIGERKKIELEIRKLKQAVEQSSATIIITDVEGKIEYANPFFTKITGYLPDETVGLNPVILKSGHTTKEQYKELWKTISSGKTWQGEFINVKKNKEEYWERAVISPVKDDKGKIINYIAVKNDITKEKETEFALIESNKTKNKLFSIIAHDLKGPFSAILGYSNILLESHKTLDQEKRERMIQSVCDSANRAYSLLDNLLTWSHSQLDGIKYTPENINLKVLLEETILGLKGQADKKNIQIIDLIPASMFILGDKNMLSAILRNLISNAIKFTPKSGEIKIKKEHNDHEIIISVVDSGVGMPKEKLVKIFDISERTSTSGTENEQGTGLGLALCKEFIEKHNGKIWAESEEGNGSVFSFTLPEISNNVVE